MATIYQLDLFDNDEISLLKKKIEELEDKLDRQRKSQFAKIGENTKDILELKTDMEILKRNICKC
jgi:Mg2+ and Co2+ transporter CorA